MLRERLRRLAPFRNHIAAGAAVVLAIVALIAARADGMIGTTPAATSSPSPATSPTASSSPSPSGVTVGGGAGAKNIVQVSNRTDNHLEARGSAQLDPVPAPDVQPVNVAIATASCFHCDTFAVALQINLIGPNPSVYQPQNSATAVNYHCTGCTTVAIAYQYNIQSADPTAQLGRAEQLKAAVDVQLHAIQSQPGITEAQAESMISSAIAQFQDLAQWLIVQRQESTADTDPGASPPPPASPSPNASPSTAPAVSPSPTGTPAPTPSPSASP
jgi:hypothetical protein